MLFALIGATAMYIIFAIDNTEDNKPAAIASIITFFLILILSGAIISISISLGKLIITIILVLLLLLLSSLE